MRKMIEKFAATPDKTNALRLVRYLKTHPMATCFASVGDSVTIASAYEIAGEA